MFFLFRIRLELKDILKDERSHCYIYVDYRFKTIRDLEEHIKKIFGLQQQICFTCNNKVLLSTESIQILSKYDSIHVSTLKHDYKSKEIPQFTSVESEESSPETNHLKTEYPAFTSNIDLVVYDCEEYQSFAENTLWENFNTECDDANYYQIDTNNMSRAPSFSDYIKDDEQIDVEDAQKDEKSLEYSDKSKKNNQEFYDELCSLWEDMELTGRQKFNVEEIDKNNVFLKKRDQAGTMISGYGPSNNFQQQENLFSNVNSGYHYQHVECDFKNINLNGDLGELKYRILIDGSLLNKGDIIAFKTYVMKANYEPGVSSWIIGKVLTWDQSLCTVDLLILVGKESFNDDFDSKIATNQWFKNSKYSRKALKIQLCFQSLIYPRLITFK